MTNEENINNAATNYGYAVAGGCIDRGYIQDAFEAGAKWKDQQFKEYIETHKHPVLASEIDDTIVGYSIDVDEIINELF